MLSIRKSIARQSSLQEKYVYLMDILSFIQKVQKELVARTTSILRNALTELEVTLGANMTNNDVGDPHGVSVGTSSIRVPRMTSGEYVIFHL